MGQDVAAAGGPPVAVAGGVVGGVGRGPPLPRHGHGAGTVYQNIIGLGSVSVPN